MDAATVHSRFVYDWAKLNSDGWPIYADTEVIVEEGDPLPECFLADSDG